MITLFIITVNKVNKTDRVKLLWDFKE